MSSVEGSPIALRALLLVLVLASSPVAAKRLAVMPLAGEDTTGMVEALRADLGQRGEHDVLTQAQTQEKINGATDLGLSCTPDDVGCLSKLGVLGDIELILSIATATGPTGVNLVLILIDAEQGAEVGRVARPFRGAPNELALGALDELLDPEGYRGDLQIVVVQAGAEVKVGDEVWGTAPLDGPRTLAPGEYTVTITLEGFPPSTRDVTVKKGETVSVDVDLGVAAPSAEPNATQQSGGIAGVLLDPFVIAPAAVTVGAALLALVGAAIGSGAYYVFALNARVPGLPDGLQLGDATTGTRFDTVTRERAGIVGLATFSAAAGAAIVATLAGGTTVGVAGALFAVEMMDE